VISVGASAKAMAENKGSKNKVTVAREAIAEVLDAPAPINLSATIHQRGYTMLLEMERIVLDPTQPSAAAFIPLDLIELLAKFT